MFMTNKNVTGKDITGRKRKNQFLRDIGYRQGGDTKSNRSKVIRGLSTSILSPRRDSSSKDTVYDTNEKKM